MNPSVKTTPQSSALARWLAASQASLAARITRHDPDFFNRTLERVSTDLAGDTATIDIDGSSWTITSAATNLAGEIDGYEVTVVFQCTAGMLANAALSVDLAFGNWSAANYVLMPAAAYAGNRFPSRRIPYSPKLCFVPDIGPDKPVIVTDIPKLNECDGPSAIHERSGSMAVPSIGFHDPSASRGFWLFTSQGNELGDHGISIEENRDRSRALISITSPVLREAHAYRICDMRCPTPDLPRDFHAGDKVAVSFRVFSFPAPRLQSLFDAFAALRKPGVSNPPPACLPFSACLALQEEKFNRDNFVEPHGYYSVGLRQNFLQDWQIGWTGGMISTHPLLLAGGERTRANVLRNFDWLFPAGISPSGFFWDSGEKGTQWYGGDIRKPHTANWHLIRKSADAVFFILKQFMWMETLGIEVKPAWRDGLRGVCDAFVKLWRENGQFGQFVDSITGEIRVGGSTSAAIAPAALAMAARWYGRPVYQDVAAQAAEFFYQNFTLAGLSCGGPGDALQNPDSESWAALVESYVALYEATGDRAWLDRALETTRQLSTWVVSYDFRFPAGSMFERAGIHTTGSVYANTQNKHSAPGLCTLSGLGLLKLFRATGDRFPLDLLREIARGLPQYLPHPLKPLGDAPIGHMCERVNMTDWEGIERIGETLRMTTWAETSLMLTAVEIPGLYLRTDLPLVTAFDHVDAEITGESTTSLSVRIHNPTTATADVRVLVEDATTAARPWRENLVADLPVESFAPGESRTLDFPRN